MYKSEENKNEYKRNAVEIIKNVFNKNNVPDCGSCVHHFEIYDLNGFFETTLCTAIGYQETRKVYNCKQCKKLFTVIQEEETSEVIDED